MKNLKVFLISMGSKYNTRKISAFNLLTDICFRTFTELFFRLEMYYNTHLRVFLFQPYLLQQKTFTSKKKSKIMNLTIYNFASFINDGNAVQTKKSGQPCLCLDQCGPTAPSSIGRKSMEFRHPRTMTMKIVLKKDMKM